jgi:diguanylate cyclase (GGDEF)-like protein/PAS domain S-box-containing protein
MSERSRDREPTGGEDTARRADAAALPGRCGAFTGEWASALAGTSHVPMSSAEVVELLGTLARDTVAIACGVPFEPQRAADIGVALVAAHFVGGDALGRSLTVIGRNLRHAVASGAAIGGEPGPDVRISAVQEHVAAGYVRALRNRTLSEQESIRRAEIEARRRAEEALRGSEQRFRAVFTDAAIGIGLANLEGRIVEGNPAFARMLGYSLEEFVRLNVLDFILPEDAPGMWESYAALLRGELECVRTKKRYRRKDGGVVWTNLTATLIRDASGQPQFTLALVEDISERQALEEKLRYQATHDPLTGVANRSLFLDRLAAAVAEPDGRLGICYLDLDGFKAVNDTMGHDIGDELLIAVARRLERRVTEDRGLVARMGGDEFVLLVEHSAGLDAMVALAHDVLNRIEQPFRIGGHRIRLTTSIGIVERPAASTRASDLVKDADSALYWAKTEGPGRLSIYDPARQARDKARMTLTTSIRSALENNQFTVVYQPIVELPGGALRGVEALLRWNHPTMGLLPPEAFIELAESSGAITPLGRWVMETACEQAAAWHRLRPEAAPFMSVNVSVTQAADSHLVGDVARVIDRVGLAPAMLQVELTESAMVEADSRPLETVQKLSAMGTRIAVDDFGSGYSNLAYLRRLPVDTLKLSASFLKEVWPDGPADEPVISALAGLAHRLGLTMTVEGVETSEQAERLAELGCDTAQGWYFASALPGEQITALLRDTPRPSFPL